MPLTLWCVSLLQKVIITSSCLARELLPLFQVRWRIHCFDGCWRQKVLFEIFCFLQLRSPRVTSTTLHLHRVASSSVLFGLFPFPTLKSSRRRSTRVVIGWRLLSLCKFWPSLGFTWGNHVELLENLGLELAWLLNNGAWYQCCDTSVWMAILLNLWMLLWWRELLPRLNPWKTQSLPCTALCLHCMMMVAILEATLIDLQTLIRLGWGLGAWWGGWLRMISVLQSRSLQHGWISQRARRSIRCLSSMLELRRLTCFLSTRPSIIDFMVEKCLGSLSMLAALKRSPSTRSSSVAVACGRWMVTSHATPSSQAFSASTRVLQWIDSYSTPAPLTFSKGGGTTGVELWPVLLRWGTFTWSRGWTYVAQALTSKISFTNSRCRSSASSGTLWLVVLPEARLKRSLARRKAVQQKFESLWPR